MVYDFDQVHDRRGTYCTQWDFIQDRFGEPGLLPFSISDTDFRCPEPIVEALHELVGRGIYGYTRWNHHDFKGAVTSFLARRHGCEVPEDWVLYSPSVMYSVAVLIRMFTVPGEAVVAFDPMYDAFINVVRQNGRELRCSPLIAREDGSFDIDFEDLERKLEGARVMLLCSPHNPCGHVWSADELARIVGLCRAHGVKLVSDEIHMDLVLGPHAHIPALSFAGEYRDIYLVASCTKTLNVPGLGGSYALIPDARVRDAFLTQTRFRDFLNSASLPGLYAHMVGYTACDDYIDQLVAYVRGNMERVAAFVEDELPGLRFRVPEATYLAWIDARALPWTSDELQDALVHVGRVGIMPGETYGDSGLGYLRLNCGCPRSKLDEGLQRMKASLAYLEQARG